MPIAHYRKVMVMPASMAAGLAGIFYIWSLIAVTPPELEKIESALTKKVTGVETNLVNHVLVADERLIVLAEKQTEQCQKQYQSEIDSLYNAIMNINLRLPASQEAEFPDLVRWRADLQKQMREKEADKGKC